MAAQATSVALTALLNSLHTHLQNQTQLLPTLHAQLGLPPSALEDDLKDLEKQLMQSVESQIEQRRKEVDHWCEKCETVEAECLRYSKALGGNIKATGSSVGELRKVLVLPKKFEMVSEHQEKLRQVYHTKFEQLSALTNRLKALARTLGNDFFIPDVLEPVLATDDNSNDPNANMNVTPERFLKLEKELVRGKAELSKRLQHLSATFFQIDWLYTELGIPSPALDDSPSSSKNLLGASLCRPQQFSASASKSTSSDPFSLSTTPTPLSRTRSMTPLFFKEDLPSPETDYQRIFANFVAKIEEADDEGLSENSSIPAGLQDVEPTQGLLAWAENLQFSLEETKRRREAHIQAMYDQLEGLWRRLGVDEADMDAFVEAHRGSTEDTIREYEEELERMLELKRERMGAFVASAREEIMKLWDDLMIGDDERADFAPFADDEHTEELLTIHEDEIRRLKEERRQKAPLLANIKKYFDICEEEKELDAAASDQTRLLGRGRGGDPGRLLREEKMRKRVMKEKPRLEQDLLTSIPAWEEEAQRPFLVHGESILQLLMETVSAADQENKRKPARAGSVPARATTPVNSYAPGPKARPRSTSQSVPNKRQRVESVPIGHTRQGNDRKGQVTVSGSDRPPLGSHRGNNAATGARAASPSKILGRTPSGGSSLPRPVSIVMPIPKPGTQHHALGHGRAPTSTTCMVSKATSSARMTSGVYGARYPSAGSRYGAQVVVKKATRARRESFKPRPSVDGDMGISTALGSFGGRWPGLAESVREEEEG
ncbi:Anaphase spindle elongation protein 1 [Termitomyces sp. T112]|nr:Anaphase spindle elongation protein 1 [Termitomyces sp. T112]KAH0578996.1 hypothetical protein H2248_003173 [Termitomyces sp. 'cryptogamus']